MFSERTSVGLDVHARSLVAAAFDGETGEVFRARLVPASGVVIAWVRSLPGPMAVTYESGPTGFGLAPDMTAAGLRCEVAAASKLQRSAGDRKTDARDASHLARLLRLDEVTSVRIPTLVQESARDLTLLRHGVRHVTFVVHSGMDASDVAPAWEAMRRGERCREPRMPETQERMPACSYAMAHPKTGALVPACVQHSVLDPAESIARRRLLPLTPLTAAPRGTPRHPADRRGERVGCLTLGPDGSSPRRWRLPPPASTLPESRRWR